MNASPSSTPNPFFTEETHPRREALNTIRGITDIQARMQALQVFIIQEKSYLMQLNPPAHRSAELSDAQRWLTRLERLMANGSPINGVHVIGTDNDVIETDDDENGNESLTGTPDPSAQLYFD